MNSRGLSTVGTALLIFAIGVGAQVNAKERIIFTRGRGPIAGFGTALFIADVDGRGERQLLTPLAVRLLSIVLERWNVGGVHVGAQWVL